MKGARLWGGRAIAACAVLAAALAGCTPPRTAPARPARSAGGKIFDKWCSDCHAAAGGPGSVELQRKYQGAVPPILEQRTDLSPDYVKFAVRHGVSFMPSFRKTEISDAELELLSAYLAPSQAGTPRARRSGSEQGQ